MIELSSLDAVDPRDVWPNEARDFTPWLAENIDQLGAVLGMDLELRGTEAEVGAFSLDVLAHDLGSDRSVVIENQLEPTNHDHLGKLLTYAARYDAQAVVWLVREFRPEHRAALDWLNQRTGLDTAFFGVVVEAWKIDDSRPAPRFSPVVVPNDWQKQAQRLAQQARLSPRQLRYREFFQALIDALRDEHAGFTSEETARPANWCGFKTGFSGASYTASFTIARTARTALEISTGDEVRNKDLFDCLLNRKEDIQTALGHPLVWDKKEDRQSCIISVERKGSIKDDDEMLDEIRNWMIHRLLAFKDAFGPHLDER